MGIVSRMVILLDPSARQIFSVLSQGVLSQWERDEVKGFIRQPALSSAALRHLHGHMFYQIVGCNRQNDIDNDYKL